MLLRNHTWKLIGLLMISWSGVSWLIADYFADERTTNSYRHALQVASQQADELASRIEGNQELLRSVALTISHGAAVNRVLRSFGTQARPSALAYETRKRQWTQNKELAEISRSMNSTATQLRADTIFLLNAAGDTVAASNYFHSDSFVGLHRSEREYFQEVRTGELGQQFAVGVISKQPSLFYAQPVFDNGQFIGAVVVQIKMSNFSQWMLQTHAFITDTHGVIVLASDKALEFRTLPGAVVDRLSEKRLQQLYGQTAFEYLKMTPWGDNRLPLAVRLGNDPQAVVLASHFLIGSKLTIHVSSPLAELRSINTISYGLFILLAAAGSMLIVAVAKLLLYLPERRKAAMDQRIAATAFDSQEATLITDANCVILRVNRAFVDITGFCAKEVEGKAPNFLEPSRHDADFYTHMRATLHRTGAWQGEVWVRRKNGEAYPARLVITAVKGADGQTSHYVAMYNDMTQRKAAELEIEQLAYYDPLTLLPNRRLLQERLQQALTTSDRNGHHGALMFIDIDNLKIFNDSRGHGEGDRLLQQVAQRLAGCMREGDLVAHLGGDEFVVLLESLSQNSAEAVSKVTAVGEKILAILSQPYPLAGSDHSNHYCSASIGVALINNNSIDNSKDIGDEHISSEDLLRRADLAMYQAKATGRNSLCFFDPAMQAAASARAALEADLRQGLQLKQFSLHYQPQIASDGRVLGAEALLRWRHPARGMVAPLDFIPLAEDTGLIFPLGLWVLHSACRQLVAWASHDRTADLVLAVNVSALQFRQAGFVAEVLGVLAQTGARGERLKLELTESVAADDVEDIIEKMLALKVHSVSFSVDDFGTGYSSLQYLRRLPLNQIKIDKSFVNDVLTDPNAAAVAKTIITLGKSLGLEVMAEGVETEGQRDFLAQAGCLHYQGYLFSKPLEAQHFEEFMNKLTVKA